MLAAARQLRKTVAAWRLRLGNDLIGRGVPIADDDLTVLIDTTLERCLALRLSENRGIIAPGTLARLAIAAECHAQINARCQQLFGLSCIASTPAEFSDAALGTILSALSAPRPPDFTTLSFDALGTIREFLHDHPLRIDPTRRSVAEICTGTRKTSGSYYTPTPIVDYLVRQTLTPFLSEAGPKQSRAVTVLDPACGAGAFLLGAYRFLLNWHLEYYRADPQRYGDELTQGADGSWQLTLNERRRILQEQIYGVDRDPRALETTRLTLLLQFHEGCPSAAHAPPPDLNANLRRGDTLIGPAICHAPSIETLTAAERATLLPLDWHVAFPAIMARGGFDAVIGNPPYLSYSGRQAVGLLAPVRRYLRDHYNRTGWPAAHAYFIEQATRQLARRRIAFVVPAQVGHLDGYAPTRALLLGLAEVRYWGEAVFAEAVTPALTFIADKEYEGIMTIIEQDSRVETAKINPGQPWRGDADAALLDKLYRESESLGSLVGDVGVHTGNCASAVVFPTRNAPEGSVPILEGKDVGRYRCATPAQAFRVGYAPAPGEYSSVRPQGRYSAAPFVIRQTAAYPIVGPRRHAIVFRNSLLALYPPDDGRAVEYLVGILNSRLCRYVYSQTVREGDQRAFPQVKIGTLRRLPIRRLDLTDQRDGAQHDAIVSAVRQLLALHEEQSKALDAIERERCHEAIANEDHRLDRLIYELYRLTAEEVAIIERSAQVG